MLNREQVAKLRGETINESFMKVGDSYRGTIMLDIPKSLITKIRRNAKQQLNIETTENYSDIIICDLIVQYVKETYINEESIPVSNLFGTEAVGEPGDAITEPVEKETGLESLPSEDDLDTPNDSMEEIESTPDDLDTSQQVIADPDEDIQ